MFQILIKFHHYFKLFEKFLAELFNYCMSLITSSNTSPLFTAEEAVCVVSGSAATSELYRTLDTSQQGGHVIPALLSLTIQWPHETYKIGNREGVLIKIEVWSILFLLFLH